MPVLAAEATLLSPLCPQRFTTPWTWSWRCLGRLLAELYHGKPALSRHRRICLEPCNVLFDSLNDLSVRLSFIQGVILKCLTQRNQFTGKGFLWRQPSFSCHSGARTYAPVGEVVHYSVPTTFPHFGVCSLEQNFPPDITNCAAQLSR